MDLKHSETSEMGKKLTLKVHFLLHFFQAYFLLFTGREKDVISQTSFRKNIKRQHLKQKRRNVDDDSCCAGIFPYK